MRTRHRTALVVVVASVLLVVVGFVLVLQGVRGQARQEWRAVLAAWEEADVGSGAGTRMKMELGERHGWGTLFHSEHRYRGWELVVWATTEYGGEGGTTGVTRIELGTTSIEYSGVEASGLVKLRVELAQERRWLHHAVRARVRIEEGDATSSFVGEVVETLAGLGLEVELGDP